MADPDPGNVALSKRRTQLEAVRRREGALFSWQEGGSGSALPTSGVLPLTKHAFALATTDRNETLANRGDL